MPNSFRGSKGGEVTARGVFSAILHRRPRLQRRGTGSPLLFFFLPGCRGRTKKSQFQYGKKMESPSKGGERRTRNRTVTRKGGKKKPVRASSSFCPSFPFLSFFAQERTATQALSGSPLPHLTSSSSTFPALFSLPFPLPSSKRGERFSFLFPSRFSLSRRAIPYDDDDAS